MAKSKTAKCPYLSSYGGGYVRPDQWLTEKLCEVVARQQSKELPDKFWKHPNWSAFFRRQTQIAASLLNVFNAEAIAAVLADTKLKIRSFQAFNMVPFLYQKLEKAQRKHEIAWCNQIATTLEELNERDRAKGTVLLLPKHKVANNKLAKLRELDGERKTE